MAKSILLRLTVIVCLFSLASCKVSYTVISHGDSDMPAQAHQLTHVKTHYSYLWGLVSKNDPLPAECGSGSNISKTRVTTTPGFIIISFITIGIVIPQRIEWDCSQVQRDPAPAIGH
ncbi:MAG: hypothetical protein ABJA78_20090 [Ferruginibacter sp.]